MRGETIRCPSCGTAVSLRAADAKGDEDPHAQLTCPTCATGFDREGKLVHEPVVAP